MKEMFICDSCQRVFDDKDACKAHEFWCLQQQREEGNAGDGTVRLVKLALDLSGAKPRMMRQVFDVTDRCIGPLSPDTVTVWRGIAFDGGVKSSTEDPRKAIYIVYFDTRRMAEETARLKLVEKAKERLVDAAAASLKLAREHIDLSKRVKEYEVVEVAQS